MKGLSNLLSTIGIIVFIYAVIGRFIGDKSIMGFSSLPFLGDGFSSVGMLSGAACLMLISIILMLKTKD